MNSTRAFLTALFFSPSILLSATTWINGVNSPGNPAAAPYVVPADTARLLRINGSSNTVAIIPIMTTWAPSSNDAYTGYASAGSNDTTTQWASKSGNDYPFKSQITDTPLPMGVTRYELWLQKTFADTGDSFWYFDKYATVDTSGNIIGALTVKTADAFNSLRALEGTSYSVTATQSATVSQIFVTDAVLTNVVHTPPSYLEAGYLNPTNFLSIPWQPQTTFSTNPVAVLTSSLSPTDVTWQLRISNNLLSAPESAVKPDGVGSFFLNRTNAIPVGSIVVDQDVVSVFGIGSASTVGIPTAPLTNIPAGAAINGRVSSGYPQSVNVITIETSESNSGTWQPITSESVVNNNNASLTPVNQSIFPGNGLLLTDFATDNANYRVRMFTLIPYSNLPITPPGTTKTTFSVINTLTQGAVANLWGSGGTWLEFTLPQNTFTVNPVNPSIGSPATNSSSSLPAAQIITQ